MRPLRLLLALFAVLVLAAVLAGCASPEASAELVEHTDPVPDGVPVMYEFFTLT